MRLISLGIEVSGEMADREVEELRWGRVLRYGGAVSEGGGRMRVLDGGEMRIDAQPGDEEGVDLSGGSPVHLPLPELAHSVDYHLPRPGIHR